MKSERKKLVDRADSLFSSYVRQKNNNICEHCGGKASQVHHYLSRRHYLTRWEEDNCLSVCWACHLHWCHSEAEKCRDYLIARIGGERFHELKKLSNEVAKYSVSDYKELISELEDKIVKLI